MFRAHGHVALTRTLFDDTQCPACLKQYFTCAKLKAHLRTAHHCRRRLCGNKLRCAPAPGAGSLADRELATVHDGLCPVQQGSGPSNLTDAEADLDFAHYVLHTEIVELLMDFTTEETFNEMLPRKVLGTVISWTSFQATLDQVIADTGHQDAMDIGLSTDYIHRLLRSWQHPSRWMPYFEDVVHKPPVDFYAYDEAFADLASRATSLRPPTPAVPRGFGKVRYVLHAYSGRRRFGDVQHFIDLMAHELDTDIQVVVLSVDLIISSRWGDLCSQAAQDHWLAAIRAGQIVGLLAGPPCNTWSRARAVALEAPLGRRGPRPVRASTSPWGNWVLSLRELAQVIDGNTLMFFAIRALLELHARGGVGIVEHPAEPEDDPTCATVWKTPLMRALLRCPGLDFVPVHQGPFGSEALKPTGLAVLNLPTLPAELQRWRLCEQAKYQKSHGLNSQGYHAYFDVIIGLVFLFLVNEAARHRTDQ
eukprot:Skav213053  [mRNA]  locus=scaffold364:60776:62934:+ [translate_table: standard]